MPTEKDLFYLFLEVAAIARRCPEGTECGQGMGGKSWEEGRNSLLQSQRVLG